MRAKITVTLLACLGLALSCSRERPAPAPRAGEGGSMPGAAATPSSAGSGAPDIPQLPIDVMPRLVKADVAYPEEARARGEQGIVRVKALVGKDGRVLEAALEPDQTVSPVLAAAAVDAVRLWTFEPARSKGSPVEIWIVVPVNFRLH